jgi:hypothetical protein
MSLFSDIVALFLTFLSVLSGCYVVVMWLLFFKILISVSALTAYTYGGLMGVDISVLSGC